MPYNEPESSLEMDERIALLKMRLKRPLPGKAFQYQMANAARQPVSQQPIPESASSSAVMILLYPKNGEHHLLLIERAERSVDRHSGQISFPGGKLEASDVDLAHCATRETREETGVAVKTTQIIGQLTDMYIPVSNFKVTPFLAYSTQPLLFQIAQNEVRAIIEAPLRLLQDPETIKIKDIWVNEKLTLRYVPYYDVFGKTVWGATAMIISEFLELLRT